MKIWHLTRTAWGGAGQYCLRLSAALRRRGLDSHVLLGDSRPTEGAELISPPTNPFSKTLARLWIGLLNRCACATFHTGYRFGRWQPPQPIAPGDIVHLHGLTGWLGFNALEAIIPPGARVFWTAHDLWILSGGCVVHNGCDRYTQACRSCPLLPWPMSSLSRLEWNRKRRFIRRRRVRPLANSRWTAQRIGVSPLFSTRPDVPIVPPIVDEAYFATPPLPGLPQELNLSPDRFVIGLGARALTDIAKGIPEFLDHLAHHSSLKCRVTVLLAGDGTIVGRVPSPGAHNHSEPVGRVPPPGTQSGTNSGAACPHPAMPASLDCRFLGPLTDPHQLARFYRACDFFISPSHMETFGMMLLEAQACGTPVLAFSVGGTAEAVCPQGTHGLVAPNDFHAMLSKLSSLMAQKKKLHELGQQAGLWVKQNFSADTIAQRQQAIYESSF